MNTRQAQMFRHVLKRTGCLVAAARAAGISVRPGKSPRRRACREIVRTPPGASAGVDSAAFDSANTETDLQRAADALESEAVRRALSGVAIPVFHQGRECGNTVKHSDQLLMFLLKTLKPERYATAKDAAPPTPGRTLILDLDLSNAVEAEENRGEE